MIETIEVEIHGKKYQMSKGSTLEEISKEFQKEYKYPILLASVNNKIKELNYKVYDDTTIDFFDLTTKVGNNTHISGLTYVLLYAKPIYTGLPYKYLNEFHACMVLLSVHSIFDLLLPLNSFTFIVPVLYGIFSFSPL